MTEAIKPLMREFVLRDGENVKKIGAFELSNHLKIECVGPVLSYLEFQNRLIVLLHWYHASNLFNIYRNIFCYSKKDGSLLWQVQQPYDRRDGEPLEEIFKNIGLYIKSGADDWLSIEKNGSIEKDHKLPDGTEVGGQIYSTQFRYGVDKLNSMTLGQFPNEYWIDYETGELEWIAIHQKI